MQCAETPTPEGIELHRFPRNYGVPNGNGSAGQLDPDYAEALRASEERYRALFDLGPIAIYCCDAAGVIQQFNRRAAELWGREPALGETDQRFCGSFKLFRPDGSFMPHEQCPMAEVVSGKSSHVRDASLVEMHGGTVQAHSAGVGHGSEFVVHLPVTHEAPLLQPIAPPHETVVPPRRVLVVDYNRDAAASLAMFLKLSGHDAYIAHDGLEAVQRAAQLSPDIILLDIGLPKINGFEAARQIREQSQGKSLVLVALTGWGEEADRQRSREAGFNAHIVKPVHPEVLAILLMEFPMVGPIR